MRIKLLTTIALLAFAVSSCGKSDDSKSESPTETTAQPKAAETPPANPDVPPAPDPDEVDVPTEEDFEEAAAAEVTSENLEKELANLEKELGE